MEQKQVSNASSALSGMRDEIALAIGSESTADKLLIAIRQVIGAKKLRGLGIPCPQMQHTWSIDGISMVTPDCFAQLAAGEPLTAIDVEIEPFAVAPKVPIAEVIDQVPILEKEIARQNDEIEGINASFQEGESKMTSLKTKLETLKKQIAKEKKEDRKSELQGEIDQLEEQKASYQENFDVLNARRSEILGLKLINEANLETERAKPKVNNPIPEKMQTVEWPLRYRVEWKDSESAPFVPVQELLIDEPDPSAENMGWVPQFKHQTPSGQDWQVFKDANGLFGYAPVVADGVPVDLTGTLAATDQEAINAELDELYPVKPQE